MSRDVSNRLHTVCPYTLKSLKDLQKVCTVHIFPHAIGGDLSYSVRADCDCDNRLGATLDAELVNSPLLVGYRTMLKIPSRTGLKEWVLRGVIEGTDTRVELAFDCSGNMRIRVHDRIRPGPSEQECTIMCTAQEAERAIREFRAGMCRRGRAVVVRGPRELGDRRVMINLEFDSGTIARALLKIIYLATYEFLGDDWLGDPLALKLRDTLFTKDPSCLQHHGLPACAFGDSVESWELLRQIFPDLAMGKHHVGVLHLPSIGLIGVVVLFGNPLFSAIASVSETDTYDVPQLVGKIAVCSFRNRHTETCLTVFRDLEG